MKLSRKLIPAMIMLLVSAVLMSTASFAWFSTNTTATANGMDVKIAAAKNLVIAKVDDGTIGTYAAAQDLDVEEGAMIPASTAQSANPAFYYVSDAEGILPDNYAAGEDTEFALSTTGKTSGSENVRTVYVHKQVSLMATGEYQTEATNHGNIVATVSATRADGKTSPVDSCLRVMLVVNGTAYLYAPIEGATEGDNKQLPYVPVVADGETGGKVGGDSDKIASFAESGSTVIIEGMTKDEAGAKTVDIYIWYEGQDVACTAANAIKLGTFTVTVDFSFA